MKHTTIAVDPDDLGAVRMTMWVPLEGLWMHDSRWHKSNWPIRWSYLCAAAVLADDQEALKTLEWFSCSRRQKADRDAVRAVEDRLFKTHGQAIQVQTATVRAKLGRLVATVLTNSEGIIIDVKEAE